MSSLADFKRLFSIYGNIPVFICGTLGNLLSICGLWRNRHNPCAFLLLLCSIFNCLALLYGPLINVLNNGFFLDWSTTNLIWCKTRLAFTQTFIFISLSCVCLASVDRYFCSCRQKKLRELSRLSIVRWAIIIISVFWTCDAIPYLVYGSLVENPIKGTKFCTVIPSPAHAIYETYIVFPVYLGILPNGILIITGLLTFHNIKKLQFGRQRQAIQKQLTLAMLIQTPIVVISTLPFAVFIEYTILTAMVTKTSYQRNIEVIITNILNLLFYVSMGCQFFVLLISSPTFRTEMKYFILCRHNPMTRLNQVQPMSITLSRFTTVRSMKN